MRGCSHPRGPQYAVPTLSPCGMPRPSDLFPSFPQEPCCSQHLPAQGQEKQKLMEKWDRLLLSFGFVPWPVARRKLSSWPWHRSRRRDSSRPWLELRL